MKTFIIQCGGYGARMGSLTSVKPKTLIPIDGKAILFHLIDNNPDCKFIIITDYHADVLIKYVKKYKPNILSAPSWDPSSKVGKEAWCKINLKNDYKKLYLYSRANKQLFSASNRILIDDMEQTINEWNAKGGVGILHTSAASTINQLKKLGL